MYRIFLFLLLALVTVRAQVPFIGSCPSNVVVKQDFQPTSYLGLWYEQEKYFAIFELGGKCITATYTSGADNAINVLNKQLNVITGAPTSISGSAVFTGPTNIASLLVTFPSVPLQIPGQYKVLGTDYTTYAVVYSCSDFIFFHTKIVWILTRDQSPSVATMQAAYAVLDRNGLTKAFLLRTDQKNCPAT